MPMVAAKTESSVWIADLLLRFGAQDVEVDQEDVEANVHLE